MAAFAAILIVAMLGGCGGGGGSNPSPPPPPPPSYHIVSGTVMSGGNAIAGATVTAWAANPTRGAPATKLGEATSDGSGEFSVDASSQPGDGTLIYVTAADGDAGGGANGATLLATVAGAWCASSGCGFPAAITINELTSAATAYSLAGFISISGGTVNVSGASPGLGNAVLTFASLVDVTSGESVFQDADACTGNGEPANCYALRKLDTLADFTAACVQSNGAGSAACKGLLGQANSASNTFAALYNLAAEPVARNDGAGLFAAGVAAGIYLPVLETAPNDWSLALVYGGGGLYQPAGIAVDGAGNVWLANYKPGNNNGKHDGAISKFAPNGAPLSPDTGFTGGGLLGSWGIAIDADGNAWVGNWNGGDGTIVSEIAPDGTPIAPDGYTISGISPGPMAIAVAPDGSIWVGDFGNSSLSKLDTSGNEIGQYTGGGIQLPVAVAVDAFGDVWTANQSNDSISEFTAAGLPLSPDSGYTGGGLATPDGLALDATGNAWVPNFFGGSVSEFVGGNTPPESCPSNPGPGDTGCPLSPVDGFTGGGLVAANIAAVDGDGHVFVSNFHGNSITELAAADGAPLSPANGYRHPAISLPEGIAVDAAGNLWLANFGSNQVIKFIGIAAPVKTPLIGPPSAP